MRYSALQRWPHYLIELNIDLIVLQATEEAAEAEAYKVELGFGQESSLKALIAKNQQSRAQASDDFFEKLQQKYAEPKKSQTKKGQKGKKK